jgi:hypothetical protein
MEKSCGLDVHKDSVFACILDEQGKKILEKRTVHLPPIWAPFVILLCPMAVEVLRWRVPALVQSILQVDDIAEDYTGHNPQNTRDHFQRIANRTALWYPKKFTGSKAWLRNLLTERFLPTFSRFLIFVVTYWKIWSRFRKMINRLCRYCNIFHL